MARRANGGLRIPEIRTRMLQLAEALDAGSVSPAQAARVLRYLERHMHRYRVAPPRHAVAVTSPPLSPAMVAAIQNMRSAGMNQKDTAARLGISEGRVSEIFHGLRDSTGQWIP
jgi:hypothetical protein